jgi:quercetin dioxygenase-like cupin family protein
MPLEVGALATITERCHVPPGQGASAGSRLHGLSELAGVDVLSLLAPEVERSAEVLTGMLRLRPGQEIAMHVHNRSETIFLVEGSLTVGRGSGRARLDAPGAAYFPAGIPHGMTAAEHGPASLLINYTFGVKQSEGLSSAPAPERNDGAAWANPNIIAAKNLAFRWALAEEFEPWVPVEPTKGWKDRLRYLLDPQRGAPDLVAGTAEQPPGVHYTIHRHEPPEIYYVLSGKGVIYVGSEAFEASSGSTIYIPSGVTHGIDTFDDAMRTYWLYGLDHCGPDWTWEAAEDIYPVPSPGAWEAHAARARVAAAEGGK